MILTIAGVILSIILILCFVNIKIGTALYLAYALLVPISDITLGPIHLGDNFVKFVLLLSLLVDFKFRHKFKLRWKLLVPFIIYAVIELLIIPFQTETPTSWMLNTWRVFIMQTLFAAFVIYNVLYYYPRSIVYFRRAMLSSIAIAGIYGLFLTTTNGFNPYINMITLAKGTALDAEAMRSYFTADDRMFGRISSVFTHPMNFGIFLGLSFIYVFSVRTKIKKKFSIGLLTILALDSLFCGVRSVIGGLVVAMAFYLVFSRNLKIGIMTLIIGLIGYNIISEMPELSDYVGSIADIHNTKSNVQGSSIELRMKQFDGCLDETKDSPILGKGFQWHDYYKGKYGDHPVILAFESLIFVILCDNGILGFFIWGLLIALIMKNNSKRYFNDKTVLNSLLVFYITYACITGDYGYMQYFMIYYICICFENLKRKSEPSLLVRKNNNPKYGRRK